MLKFVILAEVLLCLGLGTALKVAIHRRRNPLGTCRICRDTAPGDDICDDCYIV